MDMIAMTMMIMAGIITAIMIVTRCIVMIIPPPGLAKRDRLPPGLQRQLRVRGTLPPGLREKMMPCPYEVEHRLPPPPPGCEHVFISGHVALVNRSTFMVMDIIHFEM